MKIGSSHSLVRARNVIIVDLVEPPTQSPAEVELWGAVLCRAIEDLTGHSWTADCLSSERVRIQREVREWFTSRRKSQGSFEWTCQVLGFDSGATRRAILTRQRLILNNMVAGSDAFSRMGGHKAGW
jgi:hypothetical protein